MKRKLFIITIVIASVCLFTGCGDKDKEDLTLNEIESAIKEDGISEQDMTEEADDTQESLSTGGPLIPEQTFEVELKPIGKVKFISYGPNLDLSPMADVHFEIEKDGKVVQNLGNAFENNIMPNQIFNALEAVAFPDYDADGNSDIIAVINYSPAAGPDIESDDSEARIYHGSADGNFTLMDELSTEATGALSEVTVGNVLSFLGTNRTEASTGDDGWKQAYVDALIQDPAPETWAGYALIYLDNDEVPEVVKIGSCEGAGCTILNFSNGEAHETQLDRLYFTYIEKENLLCNSEGNMDSYYDKVYSIINGKLTRIATGTYGAEDNSNVAFDKNGDQVYQYQWEGKAVDQKTYEQELLKVYDTKKAKECCEWEKWFTIDEIIDQINQK